MRKVGSFDEILNGSVQLVNDKYLAMMSQSMMFYLVMWDHHNQSQYSLLNVSIYIMDLFHQYPNYLPNEF